MGMVNDARGCQLLLSRSIEGLSRRRIGGSLINRTSWDTLEGTRVWGAEGRGSLKGRGSRGILVGMWSRGTEARGTMESMGNRGTVGMGSRGTLARDTLESMGNRGTVGMGRLVDRLVSVLPFVGGIVTEIGGLISHGAVVAREYGLPCMVGAREASRLFRSGERVLLDGGKGTLSRVAA